MSSAEIHEGPLGSILFAFACYVGLSRVKKYSQRLRGRAVLLLHRGPDRSLECSFARFPLDHRRISLRSKLLGWSIDGNIEIIPCGFKADAFEIIAKDQQDPQRLELLVHDNVYCDLCLFSQRTCETSYAIHPIHGQRYKCLNCDDYDCCHSCFMKKRNAIDGDNAINVCGQEGHSYIVLSHAVQRIPKLLRSASYADILVDMLLNHGDYPALGVINPKSNFNNCENEIFTWCSYRELYEKIINLGSALQGLSIQAQDIILLCACNSIEFMIVDIMSGIFGFILVPINPNASLGDIEAMYEMLIGDAARCGVMFCSMSTLNKCESFLTKAGLSRIKLVVFDACETKGNGVDSISALYEYGKRQERKYPSRIYYGDTEERKYLAAIAFTSGTTAGQPKGLPISISHRLHTLEKYKDVHESSRVGREVSLVFTGMSYHSTRNEVLYILLSGGQCGIYTPPLNNTNSMLSEAVEESDIGFKYLLYHYKILRPTFVSAVPAFWIALYNQYRYELSSALNSCDLRSSEDAENAELSKTSVNDIKVMKKMEIDSSYAAIFGTRVTQVSTGSAHTPPAVYDFMKSVIGNILNLPHTAQQNYCLNEDIITNAGNSYLADKSGKGRHAPRHVFEGYGAMEVGGIASNNKFFNDIEWKVILQPRDDISSTDIGHRDKESIQGELWIRSKHMSTEYYRNEEMTSERFDAEGYFCTGDLVELTCHCGKNEPFKDIIGEMSQSIAIISKSFFLSHCTCMSMGGPRVTVVGRTTAMLKLSDGEMLSPELVEGALQTCEHIEQIFIHAEMNWDFPLAVIVVSERFLSGGVSHLKEILFAEIEIVVNSGKLRRQHAPRAIILTTKPFTVESGLLTVSSKKCRKKILTVYRGEIDTELSRLRLDNVSRTIADIMSPDFGGDVSAYLSANMWSIGISSLRAATIASEMSSHLSIPAQDSLYMLMSVDNITNLVNMVSRYKEHQCSNENIFESDRNDNSAVWKEIALEDLNWSISTDSFPDISNSTETRPADTKTILLTGATGFLGCVLLNKLLSVTYPKQYRVVVLARRFRNETGEVAAKERIFQGLKDYSGHAIDFGDRLEIVECDITSSCFGMAEIIYKRLQQEVDLIIHCAATTSFTASYLQLRLINVIATQNIIDFAVCVNRKTIPLCYISTLSAAYFEEETQKDHYETYLNSVLAYLKSCQTPFGTGYKLTKSVSECLVRKNGKYHGLPFLIIRTGTIASDSQNGFSNKNDFTTRLLQSILNGTTIPDFLDPTHMMRGSIDLAPVDYVSELIVWLLSHQVIFSSGWTIHICNANRTLFCKLLEVFQQSAERKSIKLRRVPFGTWLSQIKDDPNDPLHAVGGLIANILYLGSSGLINFKTTDVSTLLGEVVEGDRAQASLIWKSRNMDFCTRFCFPFVCPPIDLQFHSSLVLEWLLKIKRK